MRPFCITSMETPRLLSEYLAARAQSAERISAKADVDVVMKRKRATNNRQRMVRFSIRIFGPPCA
jgi:hypothetical protein